MNDEITLMNIQLLSLISKPQKTIISSTMSKLSAEEKFFDLSDYGRSIANVCAERLKFTTITPIHITLLFGICGLCAVICIINSYFITAGILLILKSIIDAIDGELARLKQTPSYSGRYLDSIFDIILNFLFLMAICFSSQTSYLLGFIAFVCMQLQGTLYNYYYVILRTNSVGGDTTSKIFETKTPTALPGEKQQTVNVLFMVYRTLYGMYDKVIYTLDRKAYNVLPFPNWFMTLVSIYGLGFQLLIMALMLAFGFINYIVIFFIGYSVFILLFIGIRKQFINDRIN